MDPELNAMVAVSEALEGLDSDQKARVLNWALARFDAKMPSSGKHGPEGLTDLRDRGYDSSSTGGPSSEVESAAHDFAGLFSALAPELEAEKALAAAYWLDQADPGSDFSAYEVNDLLRDLGHSVGNITRELTRLMDEKPNLVIQTRKHGTTKQARKSYRMTHAGRERVKALIGQRSTT